MAYLPMIPCPYNPLADQLTAPLGGIPRNAPIFGRGLGCAGNAGCGCGCSGLGLFDSTPWGWQEWLAVGGVFWLGYVIFADVKAVHRQIGRRKR